jgi:hypothetical protein
MRQLESVVRKTIRFSEAIDAAKPNKRNCHSQLLPFPLAVRLHSQILTLADYHIKKDILSFS